jgi:hypothetical protein
LPVEAAKRARPPVMMMPLTISMRRLPYLARSRPAKNISEMTTVSVRIEK